MDNDISPLDSTNSLKNIMISNFMTYCITHNDGLSVNNLFNDNV